MTMKRNQKEKRSLRAFKSASWEGAQNEINKLIE